MIELSFSPFAVLPGRTTDLIIETVGHILRLNGHELDLTFMAEGDELPVEAIDGPGAEHLGVKPIRVVDGVLKIELRLPLGAKPTEWACFPTPVLVTGDGIVELPMLEYPPEEPRPPQATPDPVPDEQEAPDAG